jgi:chromosome segregation ATPase
MKELSSLQDELPKAKAHLEMSNMQVRALQDEIEQVLRSRTAMSELVEAVEGEKAELERKLQNLKN